MMKLKINYDKKQHNQKLAPWLKEKYRRYKEEIYEKESHSAEIADTKKKNIVNNFMQIKVKFWWRMKSF